MWLAVVWYCVGMENNNNYPNISGPSSSDGPSSPNGAVWRSADGAWESTDGVWESADGIHWGPVTADPQELTVEQQLATKGLTVDDLANMTDPTTVNNVAKPTVKLSFVSVAALFVAALVLGGLGLHVYQMSQPDPIVQYKADKFTEQFLESRSLFCDDPVTSRMLINTMVGSKLDGDEKDIEALNILIDEYC